MNLLKFPLRSRGLSHQPFSFLPRMARDELAMISEIELVEYGSAAARENWQSAQLRNLLTHAAGNSAFWKRRIGTHLNKTDMLSHLPPLTRSDLSLQYSNEPSLIKEGPNVRVMSGQTSGSTGVPTRFHYTSANVTFNRARSTAQYFYEGRPLHRNKTMQSTLSLSEEKDVLVETFGSWLGPLESVFESGTFRTVRSKITAGVETVFQKCTGAPAGYWVSLPRLFDVAISQGFSKEVLNLGIEMFIPRGEAVTDTTREFFASANIPIRATYSSEELGMIGSECPKFPGVYHVCTSNVIVEAVPLVPGSDFKQLLVTHLHSYATPLIRYEVGDVGDVAPGCPCGHAGPTITQLNGRKSALLKLANGTVRPLSVRAGHLARVVTLDEYRIRQTGINLLVAEISRATPFGDDEVAKFSAFLTEVAGPEFTIEIRCVPEIDWGASPKRLGFRCEI